MNVKTGQISPQLALKVLLQFDRVINVSLANRVKTRLSFKVFFIIFIVIIIIIVVITQNNNTSIPQTQRRDISRLIDFARMSGLLF